MGKYLLLVPFLFLGCASKSPSPMLTESERKPNFVSGMALDYPCVTVTIVKKIDITQANEAGNYVTEIAGELKSSAEVKGQSFRMMCSILSEAANGDLLKVGQVLNGSLTTAREGKPLFYDPQRNVQISCRYDGSTGYGGFVIPKEINRSMSQWLLFKKCE